MSRIWGPGGGSALVTKGNTPKGGVVILISCDSSKIRPNPAGTNPGLGANEGTARATSRIIDDTVA